MLIGNIFIDLFENSVVDIDIKYLLNVYVLKMIKLVSLEIMLSSNDIEWDGLVEICKGLENLKELKWIEFDLSRN